MTENKKLNRREALKLLGAAAGASLLAGLPAKWSKPSVSGGTLPAHAQISGLTILSGIFDPIEREEAFITQSKEHTRSALPPDWPSYIDL